MPLIQLSAIVSFIIIAKSCIPVQPVRSQSNKFTIYVYLPVEQCYFNINIYSFFVHFN